MITAAPTAVTAVTTVGAVTPAILAGLLVVLAVLDGTFSGFRSSVGRTGLIRRGGADRVAGRRGLVLVSALLAPVIIIVSVDVIIRPERLPVYRRLAGVMLAFYLPFGLLVLIALAAYLVLSWRWKYLASAVILGPCTLIRPVVAVVGAGTGAVVAGDLVAALAATGAVVAVLLVEPIAGRRWYRRRAVAPVAG